MGLKTYGEPNYMDQFESWLNMTKKICLILI